MGPACRNSVVLPAPQGPSMRTALPLGPFSQLLMRAAGSKTGVSWWLYAAHQSWSEGDCFAASLRSTSKTTRAARLKAVDGCRILSGRLSSCTLLMSICRGTAVWQTVAQLPAPAGDPCLVWDRKRPLLTAAGLNKRLGQGTLPLADLCTLLKRDSPTDLLCPLSFCCPFPQLLVGCC